MIPTRLTVRLAFVPALLSLAVLFLDAQLALVFVLDAVIVAVLLADALTLPRRRAVGVERQLPRVLSIRRLQRVKLEISNRSRRRLRLTVNDDHPTSAEVKGLPVQLDLEPGKRVQLPYELGLAERGQVVLAKVYMRAASRLGLWQRVLELPCESVVQVYPDLRALSEYRMLARRNQTSLLGIRRVHQPGGDNEFEQLRDYVPDDDFRHIAWRATAKRGSLISKSYQMAQDQSVVFMLDCGRMMRTAVPEATLLDHALQGFLMLSQIAISNRDNVGMLAFSDRLDGYLPPRSGPDQMRRLIHLGHDKFARLVASNYEAAFSFVNKRVRKRSLLVLATQIVDDSSFRAVTKHLAALRGRHLPLVLFLRDPVVEGLAEREPANETEHYERAAACEVLLSRRRSIRELRRAGVLSMDIRPEQLGVRLINEYLRIKGEHRL